MTWDYRVVREPYEHQDGTTEDVLTVREVYYDGDGAIDAWSAEPSSPTGATLDELAQDLEWFSAALNKPILDAADLPHS